MSLTGAVTGATAEFYLKSTQMGAATDVDCNEIHQLVRVDVLGKKISIEILEDGTSVSVSAGAVYIEAEDWKKFGLARTGDDQISELPPVQAIVYNTRTQAQIFRVEGLKLESQNISVRRGMTVMTRAQMQGTYMRSGANG
jgi:hypothetical protein